MHASHRVLASYVVVSNVPGCLVKTFLGAIIVRENILIL